MKIDIENLEYRNIFHDNPMLFLCDFEQALKDGFRLLDVIPGYPRLSSILKEVKVYRGEGVTGEPNINHTASTLVLQEYNPMVFMQLVQDAMLAGYEVDVDSGVYGVQFGAPHKATLRRTQAADEKEIEVLLESIPEVDIDPDDVVESVHAEAEAPVRKARRKKDVS